MKIKITDVLPIVNPPEVGSVHTVTSHRRAARERRERKKYFAMQKLNGVALLIFTAVAIKILEGDATIAFITVPLGLSMLLSKEMLIINKYYWKCEEKAERGVQ